MIKALLRKLLSPVLRYRGDAPGLYLSFDDGPHPVVTPQVLDALERGGVKATFFMIGQEMERHPALVAEVRERGHAIALHGRMRAVAARFGVRLRSYRPAYGELSVLRIAWCLLNRVKIVMWSFETRDSFVQQASELEARVTPQALTDGDILLFHDDTPVTAQALPRLLDNARAAGLRFGVLETV